MAQDPLFEVDAETDRMMSCEGKTKFASMADAKKALKRMTARGRVAQRERQQPHFQIEAYPCRHCTSYHIGKKRLRATIGNKSRRIR